MEKDILQDWAEEFIRTQSNEVYTKIFGHLQPFLKTRASYICNLTGEEFDDIMQELAIVLLDRLKKYNPQRGKLITYLFNSMRGDPTDTLQRMTKKKRGGDGKRRYMKTISLNQPVYDENATELGDIIPDTKDDLHENIVAHDIKELKTNKRKLYRYLKSRKALKK